MHTQGNTGQMKSTREAQTKGNRLSSDLEM